MTTRKTNKIARLDAQAFKQYQWTQLGLYVSGCSQARFHIDQAEYYTRRGSLSLVG
jgi:hypothetical protein